ncbi:MAG: hypothetical protein JSV88_26970 [Candidatus Aminicenantes bacterium]|nr:MAG: hypothetical protein JSV88_26970 [Candidatus Aminicenantes bacterium]
MSLSLELSKEVEQHFQEVVQKSYQGNIQVAIASLLKLHDKYAWKEQLREDVETIRTEVRKKGGINTQTIENAITRYRKTIGSSDA